MYMYMWQHDWVNEATFKYAHEICVNLCQVITEVLTLFALIPYG